MPKSLLQLVRESLFQPRTAAPSLIGLNLSSAAIFQATLLLSILTVLSQYLLFAFIQTRASDIWSVSYSLPIGDVLLQLASAYLVGHIVVLLARGLRLTVSFADSIVVYLWFNFLLIVLLTAMLAAALIFGFAGIFLVLFTVVWGPYALAVFWSNLLGTKNLFLGFIVSVVAFLMASAISVIVAEIVGLPVMEIIPNV